MSVRTGCYKVAYASRTRVDRFPPYPCCPTPAMVTTGNLEELGRELDVVRSVLDDLNATLARVVFQPRVAIEAVTLVACMACP